MLVLNPKEFKYSVILSGSVELVLEGQSDGPIISLLYRPITMKTTTLQFMGMIRLLMQLVCNSEREKLSLCSIFKTGILRKGASEIYSILLRGFRAVGLLVRYTWCS